ncbi:MAG: Lrp/AsnC family transcriptional regulator [Clostridium sp.]
MDKIDYKIIELLQENARYPLKHLAEEVFLSTPAVSARIEKLEEAGVITGYSAQLDPLKLGYNIKAFINLEMSPKQKVEFYPFIASCPNVLECNCVTGKYSMLIKVAYHTTLELDAFIGELQKFGNTETQIVFSTAVEHRGISLRSESEEE